MVLGATRIFFGAGSSPVAFKTVITLFFIKKNGSFYEISIFRSFFQSIFKMNFYFFLVVLIKFFFILLLRFGGFLHYISYTLLFVNPLGLVYNLFTSSLSFFYFYLRKAWVFKNTFEFFFLSLPFSSLIFIFVFSAFYIIVSVCFPVFILWLILFFLRTFFFIFLVGTFNYIYFFVLLFVKFVRLFISRLAPVFISFISFFLGFLESFLLFFSFLVTFIQEFPSVNSARSLGSYHSAFFYFFSSFWSTQFGSPSSARISEAISRADYYSLEPYFFVNLPESFVIECLQPHEAMSGMDGPSYCGGSADAFAFLQILKQHRIKSPDGRPVLRSADLFLNSYILEDFVNVEFNYRMSWIRQSLPCFVPSKYEKYIFRRYLRSGLTSILDYYNFLNSATTNYSYIFRSLNTPFYLASRDGDYFDAGHQHGDCNQFFFNYCELAEEDSDDVEDEEFVSPFSRTITYAGFHYVQQMDDFGSFTKPYSYIAPKVERYWFKRFLSSQFFKYQSYLSEDLGYFYQMFHIVFETALVFLFFIYFLGSLFVGYFRSIFHMFFKARGAPSFFYLRERSFGFLNIALFPSRFLRSLEFFFLFKVKFNLRGILESALLRFFLITIQVFSLFSFLKQASLTLFIPFRFLKFLWACYLQGTLADLISEEFDLQIRYVFEELKFKNLFRRLRIFFN